MRYNNIKFMDKYRVLVSACALAAILAIVSVCLIRWRKADFYSTVNSSLQVSEGYDRQFIDLVKRLEDELAGRAGFGYAGRKDPMTGATRAVAERPPASGGWTHHADAQAAPAAGTGQAADPIRLTAVIFDAGKNAFTAVVMNGERSYSVDVGDRVADRRVTRITTSEIYMESDSYKYVYGISGENSRTPK
ncbi:hypothetical protein R80B4_00692 [Fibrobacteres bacterium R8-0-B4]